MITIFNRVANNLQDRIDDSGCQSIRNNARGLQTRHSHSGTFLALSLSTLIFCFSPTVQATEFECRSGTNTRLIRVDYPGYDHLCEVSVIKRGEPREVKWYADFESTFCSDKIVELVGKHENQWGFQCNELPDNDGIDDLSPRQRRYLDELVQENRSTGYEDEQYTLLGTRALVGPLIAEGIKPSTNLLAVQLFMARFSVDKPLQTLPEPSATPTTLANSSEPALAAANASQVDSSFTVANRIYFISDDGENYNRLATLEDLNKLIDIERDGYSLDSAVIEALHPNGDLDVTTLVTAPDDHPSSMPSCFGQQRFRGTTGDVEAVNEHQFVCGY